MRVGDTEHRNAPGNQRKLPRSAGMAHNVTDGSRKHGHPTLEITPDPSVAAIKDQVSIPHTYDFEINTLEILVTTSCEHCGQG